jgi:tetratricopeptide (TPR) repeat protein
MPRTSRTRKPKVKRRWRIPPPVLRDPESPGPEGLTVLDDFKNELGSLLWRQLRSVLLWADVAAPDRKGLFFEDAPARRQAEILSVLPHDGHALRGPLEDLLELLDAPETVEAERIGLACTRIAAWAEGEGAPRTALEFLQAASLSCPANPRFALAVLRAARDLTQYSRAEAWFHRVVGLARQCRDWDTYVRAYIAHGTLMLRKGALPAARRSFLKALRRSTRQGLRETRAMALHDLFVVEYYMGNDEQGDAYASEAVETYGSGHERFPQLAHDIAFVWLMKGAYTNAMGVLREVIPRLPEQTRPVGFGSLARAAAGAGSDDVFREAREELSRYAEGQGVAEAWVEVARGALILGWISDAREAALQAETLARRRMEGQVRFMAESVLESIDAEERAAAYTRETPPAPRSGARDQLTSRVIAGLRTPTAGIPS